MPGRKGPCGTLGRVRALFRSAQGWVLLPALPQDLGMFCFPWLKHNFPISLLNPFLSYLNRKAFARQPPLSLREASFVVLFRRLWSFPSSSFRLGYVCVCVCVCVCELASCLSPPLHCVLHVARRRVSPLLFGPEELAPRTGLGTWLLLRKRGELRHLSFAPGAAHETLLACLLRVEDQRSFMSWDS